VVAAPVLSQVRDTIFDVPRWDDGPLVGRAEELGHLMAHVERAAAGRPSAVLLAGDAGVGKTRLLDELAVRATAAGLRVLVGHCVDLGDVGLPYLPFVDLLRPLGADPATAPAALSRPALVALLAGRVAAPPAPDEDRPGGDPVDRVVRARGEDGRLPLAEALAGPELRPYLDGWGREGDRGVVAIEAGRPLGAAWYRFFVPDAPGRGFISTGTPELTIAVVPERRGEGVGSALLSALLERARLDGVEAIALSVEPDNPALRLYERHGFAKVADGGAWTMRAEL
jgi:GNAT superfamily N-acetyltransferase